ncbi:MAG TPA: nitrilase-related carbon-nitrogen hydrolase [Tepidisphaeraceae bacterium]|nr:nitrilase-related carbon-nitrogen hydrolase [Tepidisphaeraceae bacterium]
MLSLIAGAACWVAFAVSAGAPAVLVMILCVCMLGRMGKSRQAFYAGLATGMLMYVPHLLFFRSIFGWSAIALWLVTGLPVGAFVLLLSLAHRRLGYAWAFWLTPVLWTGVEYFRSELYYLRFAWLLPGQAAVFLPGVRLAWIGVYGLGFIYALAAAMVVWRQTSVRVAGVIAMIVLAILMYAPGRPATQTDGPLHVAGVQFEFPENQKAADALERLATAHPEAQILVLSEYTFDGPVPEVVREVLRKYRRYLVAGGVKRLDAKDFYDMSFVVGPDGQDVFEQGKSVPVQCMDDGLSTPRRRVWESPWGKIGIAVCYDVSYTRVMDDFVHQGAQGLIIPTMDAAHWGEYERRMLHGRMAPIRSAEYGIPVFSVWSSGVSQLTDRFGSVIATAGYPGQGEMIAGPLNLGQPGRVPPDRWLAMAATMGTGVFIAYLVVRRILDKRRARVFS